MPLPLSVVALGAFVGINYDTPVVEALASPERAAALALRQAE